MNRNETRNTAIQLQANFLLSEIDNLEAVSRLLNATCIIKPQSEVKGCRPNWILNHTSNAFPGIWKAGEQVQTIIGKSWPNYCYAPLCVWHVAMSQVKDFSELCSPKDQAELANLIELVNILGNWRIGQGIYRFDPSLLESVANTPFDGPLSTDIFSRLPEWGIYVETPGFEANGTQLYGFFACLNQSPKMGTTLRLALDTENGLRLNVLSLDKPCISDALLSVVAPLTSVTTCDQTVEKLKEFAWICEQEADLIKPLISLIIFICTRNDEISDVRGMMPSRPKLQKTKHGERVFATASPRTWDVGLRLGAALRMYSSMQKSDQTGQMDERGTPKRPHVRSGHWHQFRYGPRKDKYGERIPPELRKLSAKWLPPKLVNCTSPDLLVPTIHPVPVE